MSASLPRAYVQAASMPLLLLLLLLLLLQHAQSQSKRWLLAASASEWRPQVKRCLSFV